MRLKQWVVGLWLISWIGITAWPAFTVTTINGTVTWTDPAPLSDSLVINPGSTLRIISADGINGGNFILNLPDGGTFNIGSGSLLDLSAQSGNGYGGHFIQNLLGTTADVNIEGIIRSNGLGTGRGGNISLVGTTFNLASDGVIEALGGVSGGNGGVVGIVQMAGSGAITVPSLFTIDTTGISSLTENMITIQADSIEILGEMNAQGLNNTENGKIMLIANNGGITLGTLAAPADFYGNLNFNAAAGDAIGYGEFEGSVAGTAQRIGFEADNGDFISADLIATGSNGWNGSNNETFIVVTQFGNILGSGYTTSGAGNVRLQAGVPTSLGSTNHVNISDVSAGNNLAVYATGANNGNSVTVDGNSSVTGHITVSGLDALNNRAALQSGVDIELSSGNLKTAMIWTDNGVVNLTAHQGSILQDASVYAVDYPDMNGKTVFAQGPVNLTAEGGSNSYIDTGVVTVNLGSDLTAKASGDTSGHGNGLAVQLVGYVGGSVSVTDGNGNKVPGNVVLGNDNNVLDVVSGTTIKATGTVRFSGSHSGPMNISAGPIMPSVTKTVGFGVDQQVQQMGMLAQNIGGQINKAPDTTPTTDVFLTSISVSPRENAADINLSTISNKSNIVNVSLVEGYERFIISGSSIVIHALESQTSSSDSDDIQLKD